MSSWDVGHQGCWDSVPRSVFCQDLGVEFIDGKRPIGMGRTPRVGGVTFCDLRKFLGMRNDGESLRRLLEQAGVRLSMYVRNDAVVRNRHYKQRYRLITFAEARRVMELHYLRLGAREEARLRRELAKEEPRPEGKEARKKRLREEEREAVRSGHSKLER